MRETRAVGKGLIGVICSLLMVLQPVWGAQAPSVAGAVASSGQIPVSGASAPAGMRVGPMLVALPLPSHSEVSHNSELIAVANLTGTAERNGRPLLNGSIVSSGDFLSTHGDSALLLASAPEERLWLGPNTSAKLTKDGENVAVALERGALGFQTRGHIEVTFEEHDGLAIRSRSNLLVLAQLSFVNNQEAQVRLEEGSLELVQGNQSILLQPEQSRLISVTDAGLPAEPKTTKDSDTPGSAAQSNTGSIKGTVVDSKLFVVAGANVTLANASGTTLTTVTNQQGNFTFKDVPPGTYTLSVTHAGFPSYETQNVVVSIGKESSVYVQLAGGGGGGNKHTGLIIGVVAGVGAAAGIGVALASSKKSTSVSPSE
jgi:hypothetical protein